MILTKKNIHDSIQSTIRAFGECCGYRINGDESQLTDDDIIHGIDFKCVMKKKVKMLAGDKPKMYCSVLQTRTIYANHEDEPDMYVVDHIVYYDGKEDEAEHSYDYYYMYDDEICTDSLEEYVELITADAAKDSWLSEDSSYHHNDGSSYDKKDIANQNHLDFILEFMLNKLKKKYCAC